VKKLTLLAAVGAGYVLGSRAGRERYEQIRSQARKVAGNPRVQSATDKAKEVAAQQAAAAASVAKDKVTEAAHAAADKVGHQGGTTAP